MSDYEGKLNKRELDDLTISDRVIVVKVAKGRQAVEVESVVTKVNGPYLHCNYKSTSIKFNRILGRAIKGDTIYYLKESKLRQPTR